MKRNTPSSTRRPANRLTNYPNQSQSAYNPSATRTKTAQVTTPVSLTISQVTNTPRNPDYLSRRPHNRPSAVARFFQDLPGIAALARMWIEAHSQARGLVFEVNDYVAWGDGHVSGLGVRIWKGG
jgi:hypothetical protein